VTGAEATAGSVVEAAWAVASEHQAASLQEELDALAGAAAVLEALTERRGVSGLAETALCLVKVARIALLDIYGDWPLPREPREVGP
jgi:hypothetical protein